MAQKSTLDFLKSKKKEMKESKYRKSWDLLSQEIQENLVNTIIQRNVIDETSKSYVYIPTVRSDGATDYAILPRVNQNTGQTSQVPRSAEPIAFAKILIGASAIASSLPDGTAYSTNKIKARFYYEMWKRSWSVSESNGMPTLDVSVQNLLTYGWAAWRVYPKQLIVDKTVNGKKTKKIIFDDIYREALDPRRTWIGLSYKAYSNDNRPEVYYEIDVVNDDFVKLKKEYGKRFKGESDGVSEEAETEDAEKSNTHTTLGFYEDPKNNRLIIASKSLVLYDGEMPNDDIYGTTVLAHCFIKDMNDPHGVGLYEMMRGNTALYNYINSLNAEQVEAEIHPILFAKGMVGQGDLSYKRSPNRLNPLPQGASIERILTTGNTNLGINYANAQKRNIEDNTGLNDIVSGSNSGNTLGSTVILREAALNRLIKPRNSLKQALENDACIFFSQFEQGQVQPREFIFSSEEEAIEFAKMNQTYQVQKVNDFGPNGEPIIKVYASEKVPVTFDFDAKSLEESDFEDQNINEFGDAKFAVSKETAFNKIKSIENKYGFDRVVLLVDTNSMLVPSQEIKKQATMSLFPVIQNSITMIYGLAKQDPEQAIAQLRALEQFLKIQKENIFDYIPKGQYDQIMSGQMVQPMDPMMGAPRQADGTEVTQPQNPREMSQSRMDSSFDASMGKLINE